MEQLKEQYELLSSKDRQTFVSWAEDLMYDDPEDSEHEGQLEFDFDDNESPEDESMTEVLEALLEMKEDAELENTVEYGAWQRANKLLKKYKTDGHCTEDNNLLVDSCLGRLDDLLIAPPKTPKETLVNLNALLGLLS